MVELFTPQTILYTAGKLIIPFQINVLTNVALCKNAIIEWQRENLARKRVLLGSATFLFVQFFAILFRTTLKAHREKS